MALDRRLLYSGLFLAAIGVVAVAADLTGVDRGLVRRALQLWPLAIIALGAGIVLRRTPVSLPAGVLAAIAPGLLLGGGLALGPPAAGECGSPDQLPAPFVRAGTASELDRFDFTTGCGTATFTTQPGDAWSISAGRSDGREPQITDTGNGFSMISPGAGWRQIMTGFGREELHVVLPTTTLESLGITANANATDISLPGASIGLLSLEVNGSNVRIDATDARLEGIGATVKFGNLSMVLPAGGHLSGAIGVEVGSLRLCQPPGTGLRVELKGGGPREVRVADALWTSDAWQSEGTELLSNQLELTIRAKFASVDINPIGGCS